ncbi:LysE/ArgO family amino acid transporter [Alteromonas sp. a30]|uniref:LysE/ArgO family amino acid transporter n=1 Tax=Alteromonas sp. a30 TaxID=2730917 RepID=UPI00227E2C72|nr:LysE/ArgO family amino acid transporter [Alteromonas sp. a30]MCY7296307.1 amino acid transporter [Alteromonas sp. a30]
MIEIFTKGFLVSGGLIMAIGTQNAFVLKQGLLKQHIGSVILICFLCDVLLISSGVLGLGYLLEKVPSLSQILAVLGAAFLLWYGFNAFKSAWRGTSHLALHENNTQKTRNQLIAMTLAITLLNPHVYLDTLVIVGGIGGTLSPIEKPWFLFGALVASSVWFVSLGYGSRMLTPLFAKPRTWQWLDAGIGIMMWWIALELIKYFL